MRRDHGIAAPGTSVPPPSLKVRGCGCPSAGSVPVLTPREASEWIFGNGKKVQAWKNKETMMDGMVGWGSDPPTAVLGLNWSGLGLGSRWAIALGL